MLKYQHIAPNTAVRAYDFEPMPGRTDRFVEGVVVRHENMPGGWNALVVVAVNDSAFPADANRVGREVFVPMETGMDYDGRVEVL